MFSKTRPITVFVLAFLCLNIGGAVCLTMCAQAAHAAAMPIVGMHMDGTGHCSKHKPLNARPVEDSTAASAEQARCCSLPVSFFAAPLEKRFSHVEVTPAAALPLAAIVHRPIAVEMPLWRAERVYRPPALDVRSDRTKFCVLRI